MISLECSLPQYGSDEVITSSHGSGGACMHRLIKTFTETLTDVQSEEDSAIVNQIHSSLAVTTDSFVINPIFFRGGNIGSLSVYGTVNDLLMRGAVPLYLTCAFIIEEGFPLHELKRIVDSISQAAKESKITIVTGDTKVVERGAAGGGMFINTTGVGYFPPFRGIRQYYPASPKNVKAGQVVIVSGDIGRHGMAVIAERNGFETDPLLESDCASLKPLVDALYDNRVDVQCMRDLTRGGLGTSLCEIAKTAGVEIFIDAEKIPVDSRVESLGVIQGIDPLFIACEGRFVVFVYPRDAERAVKILRQMKGGENATIIGEVLESHQRGVVTQTTLVGNKIIVNMPEGEILPRIC